MTVAKRPSGRRTLAVLEAEHTALYSKYTDLMDQHAQLMSKHNDLLEAYRALNEEYEALKRVFASPFPAAVPRVARDLQPRGLGVFRP